MQFVDKLCMYLKGKGVKIHSCTKRYSRDDYEVVLPEQGNEIFHMIVSDRDAMVMRTTMGEDGWVGRKTTTSIPEVLENLKSLGYRVRPDEATMMDTVVNVTVKTTVHHSSAITPEDAVEDAISNMDYSFVYDDLVVAITDTEVTGTEVIDV
jgi:hypothetical protein